MGSNVKRKALVVGAGISGLCTSLQLLKLGWEVLCLESKFPGSGCTHASIGLVYPTIDPNAPRALREALTTAHRNYDAFISEIEQMSGEFVVQSTTELMEIVGGSDPLEKSQRIVEEYKTQGIVPEFLSSSRIKRLEPMLRDQLHGLLYKDVKWVNTVSLLEVLVCAFQAWGGRLVKTCTASAVEIIDGACVGAVAGGELLGADATVICAGAWTRELLGMPNELVMRGQTLLVRGIQPLRPIYVGGLDIVPLNNNCALIGATQELGVSRNYPTVSGIHELAEELKRTTNWPLDCEILELRSGIRSCESDGLPIVGPVPGTKDLYALTGLWRNGIGLAPALAAVLARQVDGSEPKGLDGAFSPIDRW